MLTKTLYRSDMLRCVLCHDAPCTSACGRLDPAGLLRRRPAKRPASDHRRSRSAGS